MHVNPASLLDSPRALRTKEYSTLRSWHNRLGHRNFRSVGAMMKLSVPRKLPTCTACLQGKMKANPHPPVLERCSKPFDRVHSDLVPLDGISFGGSKYMLLLVDDYTRFAWCFFASSKHVSAIAPLLQGFINMILTQFDAVIKSWRTDGGTGEFSNSMVKEINRQFGILHQLSTSGVKQQNGVLERRVQTIKNMERSMRAGAGVLDDYRLQAESLATSVFLSNLLPCSTLGNISPHLLLYNKQPSLVSMKPWGCLVWVHLRKEHRSSSSDPRCRPAMMVGYVQGSKSIYKCLDLYTL
jgi:transposase InsO family protein